jgi:hypothetical protein
MDMILKLLLRAVLLMMGLVFFASLLVATLVVLAVWLARASWARMNGQPVAPWQFRFDPRARWNPHAQQAGSDTTAQQPAQRRKPSRAVADITDVVPKEIKPADAAQP